jgi:cytochrome c-type biogenesis protein
MLTVTTILAAFAVGFASFLSPCVLPLVPGYLATVTGASISELSAPQQHWTKIIMPSLAFVASFTLIFVALGMTATGLGSTLQNNRAILNKLAGLFIIILGVFFLLSPFISKLNRTWHLKSLINRLGSGSPFVAGGAFAFAWTPCVGPTLGAILTAAATQHSVASGGLLLVFYSAGLAVPFIISAIAFERATKAFTWLRNHYRIIAILAGLTLIAMGILVFTGELTRLNAEAQRMLSPLGLDFIYSF